MPKPEERPAARPHDLILESRTTLTVTGVQKVLHCSPESAALETGKGTLHLAGAQLSVVSLDLEAGEAKLTGRFDALEYTRTAARRGLLAPASALMLPVLQPAQLGRELAACTILGAAVGVVRAFFPVRGRGAFVPDALLTGAVLFGVQSYAAALSSAGVLRWYMVLAAFAAALCTAAVLGIPVRWAGQCLAWVLGAPVRLARQWVLRPLAVRHAARRAARKERRNAKRTAKNPKKNLPNQRRVLYNSNVSK